MDQMHNLILLKGEIKTPKIQSCQYDSNTAQYRISFGGDRVYTYNRRSVEWMTNPKALNPALYQIVYEGTLLTHIALLLEFSGSDCYWHIVFESGAYRTVRKSDLQITHSCLSEKASRNTLSYLKALAQVGDLKSEDGKSLLSKIYDKLDAVDEKTVLASYLNPEAHPVRQFEAEALIFPFGGNASQFKAVQQAMSNQLSVIQGPPGTGKTQTILNIIANLLIHGKTVQVVSNNNSATANVLEKLAKPQNGLNFLVAALGKAENKQLFLDSQTGTYPDFHTSLFYYIIVLITKCIININSMITPTSVIRIIIIISSI